MKLQLLLAALIWQIPLAIIASPADGLACSTSNSASLDASAAVSGILLSGEQAAQAATCSSSGDVAQVVQAPRDSDLDAVCVRESIAAGADPFEFCDLPPDAVIPAAVITPGLVASAFRELPLPGAELVVQPPGGRTLVNFDTNFYTERGGMTRVVRLLGQRVELRIAPSAYGWRFGDGETRQTSEPGDAFPHLEITHRYLAAGTVAPSVDVTYRADFRVGDGPWREVDGTVTIPGRSRDLRVVTAQPVLVGY